MSLFSNKLRFYIEQKQMTIYKLANIANIERSTLNKIVKGVREPTGDAMVSDLCKALQLSIAEENDLCTQWHITQIGEATYMNRKKIQQILTYFYNTAASSQTDTLLPEAPTLLPSQTEAKVITGGPNVNATLRSLLQYAAAKPHAGLQVICQPDYDYLYDCLLSLPLAKLPLTIDNIICFDKAEAGISANLGSFSRLVPFILTTSKFHAYYIYDNAKTLFSEIVFMPNIIIAGDYVLHINFERNKAILSHCADISELCREIFQKRLRYAKPIYDNNCISFNQFLSVSTSILQGLKTSSYFLSYYPSLTRFVSAQLCASYLQQNPSADLAPRLMQDYHRAVRAQLSTLQITLTLEGLQDFMEQGLFRELPLADSPCPLTPLERFQVLQRLTEACSKDEFQLRLLNTALFKIPVGFRLHTTEHHLLIIYQQADTTKRRALYLRELYLFKAFLDFMTSLQASSLVYSKEETLAQLQQLLARYRP